MTGPSYVLLALLAALALLQHMSMAAAVDGVIIVRGNKLYNAKTGERFFIKGVRAVRTTEKDRKEPASNSKAQFGTIAWGSNVCMCTLYAAM